MPEEKSYSAYARGVEEQYFLEKERELIAKLKQRQAKEAARKELAEEIGVSDDGILAALEGLGYNRDVVCILHLFPLVAVAWADGQVTQAECAQIVEAACASGISDGSPANDKLQQWLTRKPDPAYTAHTLQIMRDILQFRPGNQREDYRANMEKLCEEVAMASGGFLGLGSKISAEERAVLDLVSGELTSRHKTAAEKLLSDS
ncbi:MAG: hypothetical protein ABIG68_01780 [Acidobacteriota bacterium]